MTSRIISLWFIFICSVLLGPQIQNVFAQKSLQESNSQALTQSTPRLVRVAVIRNAKHLNLAIKGPYKILALQTNDVLFEGMSLRRAKVLPFSWGLQIDQLRFKLYGIEVVPKRRSAIYINRRRFRGNIGIIREKDLTLLVVNHLDLEDYLYGVLYHEVSHWWPIEVLKAQAIAARTFAIYQIQQNASKDYDLTCDVYSQVYGGATSERFRTTRAVKRTRGKVLTYQGKIFPAYYHATCGGHTEDASVLWKTDLPPLKGVACDFCRSSPHIRWVQDIPLSEIEEKLSKGGSFRGDIRSIVPLDRDESARIINLGISTTEGDVTIPAKEFRMKLGANLIRSTNFIVKLQSGLFRLGGATLKLGKSRPIYAHFEGRGWGHGVGLCQWGAYLMAREDYKAEEILKFYYPGTEIHSR